ncbi:hypothetical protein OG819_04605 [Streptomyces sp. NBC_01549]|uniref:hypothetical protein n=1 Tax=Streptomyces sp. NBC_01549 TaxID=2975874 RepID=UPI00224F1149|nr:hypothetical protein [Streptomyces sp. NBC_01549]MCX4589049.1 hypothetical protein [Streptomyces sp. NBC_01549]
MSACRSNRATAPPRLVLGFGDVGERAITEGIATIGDLLVRPGQLEQPGRVVAG